MIQATIILFLWSGRSGSSATVMIVEKVIFCFRGGVTFWRCAFGYFSHFFLLMQHGVVSRHLYKVWFIWWVSVTVDSDKGVLVPWGMGLFVC